MLGSQPDIDSKSVIDALRSFERADDVHHVHLWQMQEHEAALDRHVVLTEDGWTPHEAIKDRLKADFGVTHFTIEFENLHHVHHDAELFGHEKAERKKENHVYRDLIEHDDDRRWMERETSLAGAPTSDDINDIVLPRPARRPREAVPP
ncbi:Cation efflux family [Palleronia marisminoris]|uniref:cation transporter dimerization domain-containing protein n=1 Tax=Palleronia marisminoris TaxID=315423 RepID=UPI0008EF9D97|nr:hypothetical protein [Palleronia marisminoris]SFH29436.1 Cation efflux family [Palleronia marisminoris]